MVTETYIKWYTVNPVLRIPVQHILITLNPPAGSRVGPVKSAPNKVALSYSFFREGQSHILPSPSGGARSIAYRNRPSG